jgi:hypothetical protein
LAFSASLFHFFLFLVNSFQFFTFSTSICLRIPSIHLFLGLPQMVSSWLVRQVEISCRRIEDITRKNNLCLSACSVCNMLAVYEHASSLVFPPYRGEGVWVCQGPWELYQR